MIKVLKKFFFLAVLISNLIKKLIFSLSVFLYNRASKRKTSAIFCMAAIVFTVAFGSFLLLPGENLANNDQKIKKEIALDLNKEIQVNLDKKVEVEVDLESPDDSKPSEGLDLDNLVAKNTQVVKSDPFAGIGDSLNLINFQAEYAGSVGREEPFAPRLFDAGGDFGFGAVEGAELTPEEKEEQRRNELRNALHNNVMVKGIVINADMQDPLAIVQVMSDDGTEKTTTVKPGDSIELSIGSASISEINESVVVLTCDDVSVEKFLPQFEDEETSNMTDTSSMEPPVGMPLNTGSMSPPPPGGPVPPSSNAADPGDDSIQDARKKIEEIDKLLDSF